VPERTGGSRGRAATPRHRQELERMRVRVREQSRVVVAGADWEVAGPHPQQKVPGKAKINRSCADDL
jgi:hypothetical protein